MTVGEPDGVVPADVLRLAASGIRAGRLADFIAYLEREAMPLHSLQIYRHGAIAYEQFWWPHRPDLPHMLHSATKAFTGTAIGFAESESRLELSDRLVDLLDLSPYAELPEPIRLITVQDLLTMRTGHAYGISGATSRRLGDGWLREFVDVPFAARPGEAFTYSSATSHMLSAIVSATTGMSTAEYLTPRLFEPLGFTDWTWDADPDGVSSGGNGLSLRPVDLLNWGVLHLHDGMYGGHRILPRDWVRRASARHVPVVSANVWNGSEFVPSAAEGDGAGQGYGYQLWIGAEGSYAASGMFGQECVVLPDQDAVVAVTAGIGGWRHRRLPEMIARSLVPALADSALSPDPVGTRRVRAVADAARTGPVLVGDLDDWADLDGAEFDCVANDDELERIGFRVTAGVLTVELTDPRGVHTVQCGVGRWYESLTTVTGWQLHHSYQPELMRVVAGAEWLESGVVRLRWDFVESPFTDIVIVRIDDDQLTWSRSVNANSGDTRRPPISARRTNR